MIKFLVENKLDLDASSGISRGAIIGIVCALVAIIIALYVLRSIGIYMLAKKNEGYAKISFLAWIPIAWIYLAARLADKVIMFGKPVKNFAIIITAIFALSEALVIIDFLLKYIPIISFVLGGGDIGFFMGSNSNLSDAELLALLSKGDWHQYQIDGSIFTFGESVGYVGGNMQAIRTASKVLYYLNSVLGLASTVIFVFFYIAIFKRYYPQRMVMASILCVILPVFPIFAFVIRKRNPINYNDYIRQRNNQRYNFVNGGQGYNPYAQGQTPPQSENPFDEFAEKGERKEDQPFSEFDKDDNPFEDFNDKDDK